jgi:hypothetical protein
VPVARRQDVALRVVKMGGWLAGAVVRPPGRRRGWHGRAVRLHSTSSSHGHGWLHGCHCLLPGWPWNLPTKYSRTTGRRS